MLKKLFNRQVTNAEFTGASGIPMYRVASPNLIFWMQETDFSWLENDSDKNSNMLFTVAEYVLIFRCLQNQNHCFVSNCISLFGLFSGSS